MNIARKVSLNQPGYIFIMFFVSAVFQPGVFLLGKAQAQRVDLYRPVCGVT
jgi:hypothetical protein